MNDQKNPLATRWVVVGCSAMLLVGLGIWAYESGRQPLALSTASQAGGTGSASGTTSAAASTSPSKGGNSATGASSAVPASCVDGIGVSHGQDAANVAAAARNLGMHYGITVADTGLTGVAYRCSLIGKPGLQRSYGFFVPSSAPGATGGVKYSWYDNGSPSADQGTSITVTGPISVIPAASWSMSSEDAVIDFMENGGLQYLKDALPHSSALGLTATLSMSSGVPVWNIAIQTWLPSGAPGPLFSRAYDAATGQFCGSTNCSG